VCVCVCVCDWDLSWPVFESVVILHSFLLPPSLSPTHVCMCLCAQTMFNGLFDLLKGTQPVTSPTSTSPTVQPLAPAPLSLTLPTMPTPVLSVVRTEVGVVGPKHATPVKVKPPTKNNKNATANKKGTIPPPVTCPAFIQLPLHNQCVKRVTI
jgi:hypothetical protein